MNLVKSLGLKKILCCLILAHSSAAFAWLDGQPTVGIFGGYANTQAKGMKTFDPTLTTIVADTKTTSNNAIYGVTLGYDWTKCNFPLSLEVMFAQLGKQKFRQTNVYPVDGLSDLEHISVKSNVLLFNAYFNWCQICNFKPFIGAGLGFSRSRVRANFEYGEPNLALPSTSGRWDSKTNKRFAYDLLIGVSYEFCCDVELGLTYQYLYLGKVKTGDRTVDNLGNEFITPITIRQLDSSNLLLSLKYKF